MCRLIHIECIVRYTWSSTCTRRKGHDVTVEVTKWRSAINPHVQRRRYRRQIGDGYFALPSANVLDEEDTLHDRRRIGIVVMVSWK
jgi:hypothetical protein